MNIDIDYPALRTAIAGIGGFGVSHQAVLKRCDGEGVTRVVAACDPRLTVLGEICERFEFKERGVELFDSFEAMLAHHGDNLDFGVVTTPISFHASMHAALIARGIACYLEKPPTLDPVEFDCMRAVEANACVPTQVGFHFVHLEERKALKRRIQEGCFGKLSRVSFIGLAQRTSNYYARNSWAGQLMLEDRLILDSCFGNALSHYLNNLIFFSESHEFAGWPAPQVIEAELYRGHEIKGADTAFARGYLNNGVELRMAVSHAYVGHKPHLHERLECEFASIDILDNHLVTIRWQGGREERVELPGPSLEKSVIAYLQFLRLRKGESEMTLSNCRGFVELNALLYIAAKKIHTIELDKLGVHNFPHLQAHAVGISGIEDAAYTLVEKGLLPSEGSFPWGQHGGKCTIAELPELKKVVGAMNEENV